jgi:hypothetical protein
MFCPIDITQAVRYYLYMMTDAKAGFFAQFTPDQLRQGYARNADGLRFLLAKAERTGKKANGFTADYLRAKVAEYEALSRASDDEIRAHIARPVPPYADRKAMRDATLAVRRE